MVRDAVRGHRRGRAPWSYRKGGQDAILQSCEKDSHAPGMTSGRAGLRLFGCFFALYALTSSGNAFRVPDEFEVYFQAAHLADAGTLSVPQTLAITQEGQPIFFGQFGIDGQPYAPYGPGVAFLIEPFHLIGRAVARLPGVPPPPLPPGTPSELLVARIPTYPSASPPPPS